MRRRATAYINAQRLAFKPRLGAAIDTFVGLRATVRQVRQFAGRDWAMALICTLVAAASEVGAVTVMIAAAAHAVDRSRAVTLAVSAQIAGAVLGLLLLRAATRALSASMVDRAQIRMAFAELKRRRSEAALSRTPPAKWPDLASSIGSMERAAAATFQLTMAAAAFLIWMVAVLATPKSVWQLLLLLTGAAVGCLFVERQASAAGNLHAWLHNRGMAEARAEDQAWATMDAIGAHEAWSTGAVRRLEAEGDRLLLRVRPSFSLTQSLGTAAAALITLLLLNRPHEVPLASGLIAIAAGLRIALLGGQVVPRIADARGWTPSASLDATALRPPGRPSGKGPATVSFRSARFLKQGEAHTASPLTIDFPAAAVTTVICLQGQIEGLRRMLLTPSPTPDGALIVDGRGLLERELLGWRDQCGFVPSQTLLINGSLEENLRVSAPQAAAAELWKALSAVSLTELVRKQGRGLKLRLGRSGLPLTQGQLYRLSLARALLRSPRLLVIEDLEAELAPAERQEIDRIVGALQTWCTVIVLTAHPHHLGRSRHAVVLGPDGVVEEGSVEGLLQDPNSRLSGLQAVDRSKPGSRRS